MKTIIAQNSEFDILDYAPVGMFILKDDFTILFWNSCLEDWTFVKRTEVIGQNLNTYFPNLMESSYRCRIELIFEGGVPAIFSSQLHKSIIPPKLLRSPGMIHNTTVSPLPSFDGKTFYAFFVIEDVTDLTNRIQAYQNMRIQALDEIQQRKKAEENLKKVNKELQEHQSLIVESERLKVLMQIAGNSIHDLNAPLMRLLGSIELMNLQQKNSEKQICHIKHIEKSGQKIAQIIRKILGIQCYEDQKDILKPRMICSMGNINILYIESYDSDFEKVENILKKSPFIRLTRAKDITTSFILLKDISFDIIFMDYQFPDGDTFAILDFLKQHRAEVPVIVITDLRDDILACRMIQAGVYDYLPKSNVTEQTLCKSIETVCEQYGLKKELQNTIKKMAKMANKDQLTGLYNRRYFTEILEKEISRARRYKDELSICMLDIDYFKQVNDTYGHHAGDLVLAEIAQILLSNFRLSDQICRYGGEEFIIILPNTTIKDAVLICNRLREKIANYVFQYENFKFQITISIGVGNLFLTRTASLYELINITDQALYMAKEHGRNRVVEYR